MFCLQKIDFDFPDWLDESLFFKGHGVVRCANALHIQREQTVDLCTYFGIFPIGFWKRHCALEDFGVLLSGTGSIEIHIYATGELGDNLFTETLDRRLDKNGTVDLRQYLSDIYSSIYLMITAKSDASLSSIEFMTNTEPRRNVKLGLVITTFKREDVVEESIERLLAFIEESQIDAHLCVVDNGKTLRILDKRENFTLLKNENTGGAGGFSRGLSFFEEKGGYSHVIFMDDDASTTGESIKRTIEVLSRCIDENIAVTAAMLRREWPSKVHEQGAVFEWARSHRIVSRKHGLELQRRDDLLELTREESIEYGGWWYFAFPLKSRLLYPYPMFVRGDDWLFSYLNQFEIVAVPGIGSWQEGFEGKLSPVEQYLAMKAFLVAEIMLRTPLRRVDTVRFFAIWIFRAIAGFCYDRSELSYNAVKDVSCGPEFWASNTQLGTRMAQLKNSVTEEKFLPADAGEQKFDWYNPNSRRGRGRVRTALLYGIFIPSSIFNKPPVRVDRHMAPAPDAAFGRASVFYTDEELTYHAKRNRLRAAALYAKSAWSLFVLYLKLPSLQKRYHASITDFCRKEWWKQKNTE